MEEKYGLPFCSECNRAQKVKHAKSFAIFAGPQFVETLKCCYRGNMRYYLLHSIEPTLIMRKPCHGMEKASRHKPLGAAEVQF